jgi:ABC-type nitrate/sulfonate/bicarbonate transport system permease component
MEAAPAQATAGSKTTSGVKTHELSGRERAVLGIAGVVLFFGIWQFLYEIGTLNPIFFSSPLKVVTSLWDLLVTERTLWPHIAESSKEFGLGFAIGVLGGTVVGLVIGWLRRLDALTEPVLAAFYATPYVAFLPLIIIWFGIGLWARTLIVIWATFFPMLINAVAGVKNTPPELIRLAESFSLGKTRTLTRVVLPSSVPFILAGLRQSIGRALVGVIVAEFFISQRGVGFFIAEKSNNYQPDDAFAAILIVAVLGIVLVRSVGAIERRVGRRWGLSAGA